MTVVKSSRSRLDLDLDSRTLRDLICRFCCRSFSRRGVYVYVFLSLLLSALYLVIASMSLTFTDLNDLDSTSFVRSKRIALTFVETQKLV